MKPDRRRYADPCGIARALDVVGERWALLVVRELLLGPRRFGQLRDGLPEISPNVLAQRLRELEEDGVVRRYSLEPPADVPVYDLTERGRALEPLLLQLGSWGSATPRRHGREMSVTSMLIALKTMAAPGPAEPVTYGLELGGAAYGITLADTGVDIFRGRPARPVATLATDVTTLRLVVFLGTGVRAAESAGSLKITGDRRAAARFPRYFRQPEPARVSEVR